MYADMLQFFATVDAALLSPEDVARLCGLSRKTVYRAVERGELQAFRLCSRLRIRREDVDAWLAASIVVPASAPLPPASSLLPAAAGLRRLVPPQ